MSLGSFFNSQAFANPPTSLTVEGSSVYTFGALNRAPFAALNFNSGTSIFTTGWNAQPGQSIRIGPATPDNSAAVAIGFAAGTTVNVTDSAGLTLNSNLNVLSGTGSFGLANVGNAFTVNVSSGTVNVSAGAFLGLNSGTWGGVGQFVKDGLGILSIAASNNVSTSSGGFRLAAGELQLSGNGNSVFGTGTFIITGGTISNMGGSPTFAAPQRWEGPFTFANSTTWGATSGTVALANNPTVTVAAAATATIQGTITGTSGFTKSGNGVLSLTNTNSFTGLTAVNSGTLSLGNNLALQNSPIDTNSMSSGGRINNASALAPTIGGLSGGTDLAATSGTLFTNWASTTALTLNLQAGTSYTYSGVIANGAANMTLTKTGAGTQVLTGSNTFAGATTIAEGTLSVDRILNGGVNSPLGTNSTVNVGGTSSTPGILRSPAARAASSPAAPVRL
jgi:autotransporter-associated beta strand protein